MSSIGSSDRNSQDDSIRRARETYQQRETENLKKQKQEVRKMTEAHQAEVQRLREAHDQQLSEFKDKAKDALTRRDMAYQREMDEVRGLHREQLRRIAQESEMKTTRIEDTLKGELERSQAIDERQKALLREGFATELAARDRKTEENQQLAREMVRKGLEENRNRLGGAHEKEKAAIIKDRDARLETAQMNYSELRKAKDETIRLERANHAGQVGRLGKSFATNLKNEQKDNALKQDLQRSAFNEGLKENRERYQSALEKNESALEKARGDLTETVHGRLNKKIETLEDKLYDAQRFRDREKTSLETKKNFEVNNIRDQFQKNVEDFERQNREMRSSTNQERADELKRVNKQHQDVLTSSNRFFQEKIGMNEVRNEERFSKTKNDYETKIQNQQSSADTRFEKLKTFNSLEQEKMRAYFDRATGAMRENFDETLREMRLRQKSEQDKLFASFAEQNRETETKYQGRLQDLTVRYEKQIAEMQMKHQKELKEQQDLTLRQLKEQERKLQGEMATQNSQLSYRISKNEEAHKRELDEMKNRHQESLANLIKTRQS